LAAKGLLPAEHLLDTGYVDAEYVRHSQAAYGIEVVGPMHPDTSWQAQTPGAYDLSRFTVDWATHTVTCPQGKTNATWTLLRDVHGNPGIGVRFKRADCPACRARALCTRSQTTPRHLTLRPQALHEILQAQRQHQQTAAWQQRYHQRAGIEGTLSQGVRAFALRQARYGGLAKTRLQHILTAVAINVVRLVGWLGGVPHAKTRTSRFAALAPHAA
jgi:transposase